MLGSPQWAWLWPCFRRLPPPAPYVPALTLYALSGLNPFLLPSMNPVTTTTSLSVRRDTASDCRPVPHLLFLFLSLSFRLCITHSDSSDSSYHGCAAGIASFFLCVVGVHSTLIDTNACSGHLERALRTHSRGVSVLPGWYVFSVVATRLD